jgi:hypothetical protein
MKKTLLTTIAVLGLASTSAQALVIPGVHDTAEPNLIETWFFQANASGSSDIFLKSELNTNSSNPDVIGLPMNGLLSVWQQDGSNWKLVGANDDALRQPSNSINVYNSPVHQWQAADPTGGISDPGLTLNLTAGANYLVIQSDQSNGPTSLSKIPDPSQAQDLAGALGQTIAINSSLQDALYGDFVPWGAPTTGLQFNNYNLTITGNVTQTTGPGPIVPIPGAVWLFGSALAGFVASKRKKAA